MNVMIQGKWLFSIGIMAFFVMITATLACIHPVHAGEEQGLTSDQMQKAFGSAVFLSHVNTVDMPIFPGDPTPILDPIFTLEKDGFALQSVTLGEHSGTHWGAPSHFNADEATADTLPASSFVFPAVIIDIRAQTEDDPDYALSLQDVQAFEMVNGAIPEHAMVIAFTGWQDRWDDPIAFFNQDANEVMHYPGISLEATEWLIKNRALGGLGIDTHGVDPGADETYATNTALLKNNRIHLENLAGLDKMPAKGGWVVVGGVRNRNGSGSPATVFGFLP